MSESVIRSSAPLRMADVSGRLAEASDAALAMAIARYDREALAEVYRRYAGAVFGLARRLLGERAGAEEVVQDIYLRLWADPTRFDPARGSLRSYLLTDAHGRAVDRLRAERARSRREERDARRAGAVDHDIGREVVDFATADHVRRSMATLSDSEREAIELAYFGGFTYREVARRLDQPEGTVKSRIRSGLKRLRSELVAAGVTGGTW